MSKRIRGNASENDRPNGACGNVPANPYPVDVPEHSGRLGWPFPTAPADRVAMVHEATAAAQEPGRRARRK